MTALAPSISPLRDAATNAWARVTDANYSRVAEILSNHKGKGGTLPSDMTPIIFDEAPGKAHIGGPEAFVAPRSRTRRYHVGQDIALNHIGRQGIRQILRGEIASIDSEATDLVRRAFGQDSRAVDAILDSDDGLVNEDWGHIILDGITPATLDDNGDLFVHNELIRMLPDLVRVQRVDIFARRLFPMRMLNAPGAVGWEFKTLDGRGRAEHTADFEGRAPRAAIKRTPIRRPLVWIWSGASWTWLEMNQVAEARRNGMSNISLDTEEINLAREACLRQENFDLFFGDTATDLHGVLSAEALTNIPRTTTVAPWVPGDPATMLINMLAAERRVFQTRKEAATTLALGTTDFALVHHTTWEDGTGGAGARERSVAEVFLSRAMSIREIVWAPELEYETDVVTELLDQKYSAAEADIYAGGINQSRVMLVYTRDQAKMRGVVGQDILVRPPQRLNERWDVNVLLNTGGMEIRFPRSADITVFDGP